MKKLYYFSRSKLQFVEIKNFKRKLVVYFSLSVMAVSGVIFSLYLIISTIFISPKSISSLESENQMLKEKLVEVSRQFREINEVVDSLAEIDGVLRTAVNLPPVSEEERLLGTGGSVTYSFSLLDDENDLRLTEALNYIDEISKKVDFQQRIYKEISSALNTNQKLFHCIPAIKPCDGTISGNGFGMRMHPILGIKRMHWGIDIITDVGTPVYAPGDGIVDFAGRRGGYGLSIEIDHGFGYRTIYAHLSKTVVKTGQRIERGMLIGKTGNSGLSIGPHLHYEVMHNGVKMDPENFFFDDLEIFDLKKL
ncbi:MAG: M23 family metallopeptidase [Ignavibacteriaceae bacterium]